MNFTSETPRREFTMQGHRFTAPLVFNEGHVCSAAEAHALNQILIENTRNNFAGRFKAVEAKEEGATVPTQEEFDAYVSEYEFGARRTSTGTRTIVDPVEREAFDMALRAVKAKLTEVGRSIKEAGGIEAVKAKAQSVLDTHREALMAKAKKVVAARQASAIDELDISDLSSTQEEEAGQAA